MHHQFWKRWISLVLLAALCCGGFSTLAAPADDGAAFGPAEMTGSLSRELAAWRDDTVGPDQVRALIARTPLHPQKTGWDRLDTLLEARLASAGTDPYSQLKSLYDWMVKEVVYSWEGYSNTHASVAAYNSVTGYNCLAEMTHDGLPKTIPDDMANRAYHLLTAKKGVCYDYAIAFAVVARAVGIESYVHTGVFTFEAAENGAGHHGWCELVLDGRRYIFDPQRDARNWQYNSRNGYYFGIASGNGYRYAGDAGANQDRDRSLLPVTAGVQITPMASRSGSVTGGGSYPLRATVRLTAVSETAAFQGWYDAQENLLSTEPVLAFPAGTDQTVYALFQGDRFCDVGAGDWFLEDVTAAVERGLVSGKTALTFAPGESLTRSQAAVLLARLDGADLNAFPDSGFADCTQDWYRGAVNWAKDRNIITGRDETRFDPDGAVTRQEFLTMAVRYAQSRGGAPDASGDAPLYPDWAELADWAESPIRTAHAMGLCQGSAGTGMLHPLDEISRCQGVAILMRLARYLEAA